MILLIASLWLVGTHQKSEALPITSLEWRWNFEQSAPDSKPEEDKDLSSTPLEWRWDAEAMITKEETHQGASLPLAPQEWRWAIEGAVISP